MSCVDRLDTIDNRLEEREERVTLRQARVADSGPPGKLSAPCGPSLVGCGNSIRPLRQHINTPQRRGGDAVTVPERLRDMNTLGRPELAGLSHFRCRESSRILGE
ncbi:MAG: hypothetical protein JWN70_2218 [Planctomycetaceae bacterium]|nr:hypothetical protein [Planctomycetaceae bacterium]